MHRGWRNATDPGGQQDPICYRRDRPVTATVRILANPKEAFAGAIMYGEGPDGLHFGELGAELVQADEKCYAQTQLQSGTALTHEAKRYDPLGLTWSVSRDGGPTWLPAGVTDNTVYVTWKLPTPSTLFETPVKIGCENADGETAENLIVDKIWGEFTDRSVSRVDGMPMKYWDPTSNEEHTADEMLKDPGGNGACDAWSQLLHYCMEWQGLGAISEVWELEPDPAHNPGADSFLVKDWEFGRHIRTGPNGLPDSAVLGDDDPLAPTGPDTPCILPGPDGHLDSVTWPDDTYQDGLFAGGHYPYGMGLDARDQAGVPGQSNGDPPGAFYNHYVCKILGGIYDPSYGTGPFATELDHETASIGGIVNGVGRCREDDPAVQELGYSREPGLE
jgi:hypothetical protein